MRFANHKSEFRGLQTSRKERKMKSSGSNKYMDRRRHPLQLGGNPNNGETDTNGKNDKISTDGRTGRMSTDNLTRQVTLHLSLRVS